MIKRKSITSQTDEKQKRVKPKKIKMDLSKMQDVVVEGKLVAGIGEKVFFERKLDGRSLAIHEGIVKTVLDNGTVEIWDETREQIFCFNLNQAIPVIKKL